MAIDESVAAMFTGEVQPTMPPTAVSDTTPKQVIQRAKELGVKIVDFRFTDLPGTWQHFSVPVGELTESVFVDGIGFDGSSIRGFQKIHESDMLLFPDPTRTFLDPVLEVPTLVVVCDIADPLTRKPYSRDPRYVARKAEEYLRQSGIAETSYWGPEAEFYIFNSIRYDQNTHEGYYFIDSDEGVWNTGKNGTANLGYRPKLKSGYFPVPPVDKQQDLRSRIVLAMIESGIDIEVHHHEVGTAGQAEIDMRFDTLVSMADKVLQYKYIVKSVCNREGYTATFMPKPLFGDNGSGMHTHQSLWNGDSPLFYDADGYALLSDTARWYIGGLLKHAPAVLAFAAPTTNSYRRLVPGLRGAHQAGLQRAQPQRLRAHPDVQRQAGGPPARVPFAGPDVQPVPGVLGDVDGGPRRHPEQDRATEACRRRPLRARGHGGRARARPSRLPLGGSRRAGERPGVPAARRRVHPGPPRHVHRVQARERGRPDRPAPAPIRVLPVLRRLAEWG